MNKSNFAMEHFNYQRSKLGIPRGLEAIGETRFGTIYWAAYSLSQGLPAMEAIIKDTHLQVNIAVRVRHM